MKKMKRKIDVVFFIKIYHIFFLLPLFFPSITLKKKCLDETK